MATQHDKQFKLDAIQYQHTVFLPSNHHPSEIGQGSVQQTKLRELQVILEIANDYKKDNSLDDLGKDMEFESGDDIDWRSVSKLVYSAYTKLESLDGKKIIRKVQDLSQRASQLHEKINYLDVQKKLESMFYCTNSAKHCC